MWDDKERIFTYLPSTFLYPHKVTPVTNELFYCCYMAKHRKRNPEHTIISGHSWHYQYSLDNYMLDMDIVSTWKYVRSDEQS